MKLYFAGAESGNLMVNLRIENGVNNFLMSYYHIGKNTPPKDKNILIDSGGFTARTKGVHISVEEYAKWLVDNEIKLAFNLDTNDVNETLRNQSYLEKYATGCYIIPIYHLSDYMSCRELIESFLHYPYISIGGIVGAKDGKEYKDEFYSYTFARTTNKVKVHGLGITSSKELDRYPFYSVDSTSWLSSARYGRSLVIKNKTLDAYRTKNRHYLDRTVEEIRHWLNIEKKYTDIWRSRGIIWE